MSNRVIKFRAWDVKSKHWITDFRVSKYGGVLCNSANMFYDGVHNTTVILCRFTGLCDKNENDIYEGDIVDHHNLRYVIQWNNQMGCWENYDNEEGQLLGNGHNFFEVIGNIYENENLIK